MDLLRLPTDQNLQDRWDNIIQSANERKTVAIRYRDKDNMLSVRHVEPYELKNGKLYAFDPQKGGIRTFFTQNIEAAVKTNEVFDPRFPVKINSSILSDGPL